MRHSVTCKCLGSDESCFANFIATATDGQREDAMLIATLLVRADMAPLVASLAADFGAGAQADAPERAKRGRANGSSTDAALTGVSRARLAPYVQRYNPLKFL